MKRENVKVWQQTTEENLQLPDYNRIHGIVMIDICLIEILEKDNIFPPIEEFLSSDSSTTFNLNSFTSRSSTVIRRATDSLEVEANHMSELLQVCSLVPSFDQFEYGGGLTRTFQSNLFAPSKSTISARVLLI